MMIVCADSLRLASDGFSFDVFDPVAQAMNKGRLTEVAERARRFLVGAESPLGASSVIGSPEICEDDGKSGRRRMLNVTTTLVK
jgi:hypothetical protein